MDDGGDRTALGAALRHRRLALGLSGRQLGAMIGELPQSISNWETGRNLPSRHKVAALESALGVEDRALLVLAGYVVDPTEGEGFRRLEAEVRELRTLLEEALQEIRRRGR